MENIFLCIGENSYALREERRRWSQGFIAKHGPENLTPLDGAKLTARLLLDEIAVAPFIAERRLVIVHGVPKFAKEEVALLFDHIHPATILVFFDPAPDKRTSGVKELLAKAQVKDFPPLKGKQLTDWMQIFLRERQATIDPAAATLLLELIGEDQDALSQELAKLALFAGKRPISRADVDTLAVPSVEAIIWKLTDMITAGRRNEALKYAVRLSAKGGDAYGVWAVLLNMLKNAVAVSASVQDGVTDSKEIAEEEGIHPFALRSLLPYALKADPAKLRRFVERITEDDIALKTGAHRATDEAPEELLCLIDRFVLTVP